MPRCQECGDMPPLGAHFCIVCGAALTVGASEMPHRQLPPRPQPIRNTARLPRPAPPTAPPLTDSALTSGSMLVLWPPHAAELLPRPRLPWRRCWLRLIGVGLALLQLCAVRAGRVLAHVGQSRRPDAWARRIGATIISAGIAGHAVGLPALIVVALVAMLSIVLAPRVPRSPGTHRNH